MNNRWIILGMTVAAGALVAAQIERGAPPPAPVDRAPTGTAPIERNHPFAVLLPEPSPPVAPAPLAQLDPPAVEPLYVIETMTKDELVADVTSIEKELTDRDAVTRLNNGAVSQEERAELGALVERAALMRSQLVKYELADLEQGLADYAKQHDERVARYVDRAKR